MANRLNMVRIQSIKQLKALKWSQRRIARELGIDRGAVARHLRDFENYSKMAISPTGSGYSDVADSKVEVASEATSSDGENKAVSVRRHVQFLDGVRRSRGVDLDP